MSKIERVSIEAMAELYSKIYGENPEYEFWAWLGACSVGYSDKELTDFYNEINEMKVEEKEQNR
jgi:hypothetical protein